MWTSWGHSIRTPKPQSLWNPRLGEAGVRGFGDDLLIGGDGRDLLIGGIGADRIAGNADEDILIAGYTAYDADDHALTALMRAWSSTAGYASRTANISAGAGLTDGFRLFGDDGANQKSGGPSVEASHTARGVQ